MSGTHHPKGAPAGFSDTTGLIFDRATVPATESGSGKSVDDQCLQCH